MVSANSANCQLALKLWLKFPETSRLLLKVCQCFFNKYDSHFLCFLVRMSCYPRTATFSCYDKLVNLFEDVFRENECDIERYLQSATKLFRRSPQMGQLRRTIQSTPVPLLSIQIWGVCCFLHEARTAAQHCMEGLRGMGE